MSKEGADSRGVSRAVIATGMRRGDGDVWYDLDTFLVDQVEEVLAKLAEGSIDDEIWGKIVIMEKSKRVAKAYLRHSTIIIDGSEEEFDGKTLGFNSFSNAHRDEQTREIRQKIKEGVILKMDLQGNIKGMARGPAPIICQGWKDTKHNCVSERVARQQGRLPSVDQEKAVKLFDMRRWKSAVDRVADGDGDVRNLLPKACIRVALAKDGTDMNRTPCWFAVVNLVALDVLKAKIPNAFQPKKQMNDPPPVPREVPQNSPHFQGEQIPQLVAAAVAAQVNSKLSSSLLNADHLAQIASALALRKTSPVRKDKKERRKSHHRRTPSSGEDSALRSESSSSPEKWDELWESSTDLYAEKEKEVRRVDQEDDWQKRKGRPRLRDTVFARQVTSDYDSNKDTFDSSSCSSTVSHKFKSSNSAKKTLGSKEDRKESGGRLGWSPIPSGVSSPAPLSPALSFNADPTYGIYQQNKDTSIYEKPINGMIARVPSVAAFSSSALNPTPVATALQRIQSTPALPRLSLQRVPLSPTMSVPPHRQRRGLLRELRRVIVEKIRTTNADLPPPIKTAQQPSYQHHPRGLPRTVLPITRQGSRQSFSGEGCAYSDRPPVQSLSFPRRVYR